MTNMFGNNYYGMNYANGYGNGAPIAKPRMNNPLTEEEQKALRQKPVDQFNLSIDNAELGRAICTHKDTKTGMYATVKNPDGTLTCTICGETFDPDACTPEVVEDAAKTIKNVLQTLKYLGVDLSNEIIRGYFGFLPYVEKIPQLYKICCNSYYRYNPGSMDGSLQQNNSQNVFNAFNNLMNPGMPMYGGYMQQPVAPQGYYNPQQAAMMGTTPTNPFYAQAPQQPQQQMYNPAPQAAPMAPQPMAQPQQMGAAPVAPVTAAPGQPDQVVVKEQLQL